MKPHLQGSEPSCRTTPVLPSTFHLFHLCGRAEAPVLTLMFTSKHSQPQQVRLLFPTRLQVAALQQNFMEPRVRKSEVIKQFRSRDWTESNTASLLARLFWLLGSSVQPVAQSLKGAKHKSRRWSERDQTRGVQSGPGYLDLPTAL